MTENEKAWYSLEEVAKELKIDMSVLMRKITFLNFDEPIPLPGMKGQYIEASTVNELRTILSPTGRAHKI